MNCHEAETSLCAQSDGALSETQRADLCRHIAECASCRRLQNDLAAALASWQSRTGSVRVPDAQIEWQRLRRGLEHKPAAKWPRALTWFALPVAAAAAWAIALHILPASTPPKAAVTVTPVIAMKAVAKPAPQLQSTVVYVDDKSGWTFVWEPDNGQQI